MKWYEIKWCDVIWYHLSRGWACKQPPKKTSDFLIQKKVPFSMQKVAQQNSKPKRNLTANNFFLDDLKRSFLWYEMSISIYIYIYITTWICIWLCACPCLGDCPNIQRMIVGCSSRHLISQTCNIHWKIVWNPSQSTAPVWGDTRV